MEQILYPELPSSVTKEIDKPMTRFSAPVRKNGTLNKAQPEIFGQRVQTVKKLGDGYSSDVFLVVVNRQLYARKIFGDEYNRKCREGNQSA